MKMHILANEGNSMIANANLAPAMVFDQGQNKISFVPTWNTTNRRHFYPDKNLISQRMPEFKWKH